MTDTPKSQDDLCVNHRLFIAEWFKNGRNGTKAYRHVYNADASDEVAASFASQLLSNIKVKAVIEKKIEDINAVACIDAGWALKKRMELVERCMQAEPVMEFDKEEKRMVPTGEYKFDSSGANQSLTAIEKLHLGIAEKHVEDSTVTVVIKDYRDKPSDAD